MIEEYCVKFGKVLIRTRQYGLLNLTHPQEENCGVAPLISVKLFSISFATLEETPVIKAQYQR